jgi:RNA-directed DNA polymerase
VEDRVVQTALRNVIEPIFENIFAEHSYGFRPGRGAKDALRRVEQLLTTGRDWVVDADLKGYFDNIPQDKLVEAVAEHIADGAILELIQRFLKQGVMESGKEWQPTKKGTPQGAVISPLLANLYLNPLDHLMVQGGREMVRYADDFVILCQSENEAKEVLEQLRQWVAGAGLTGPVLK